MKFQLLFWVLEISGSYGGQTESEEGEKGMLRLEAENQLLQNGRPAMLGTWTNTSGFQPPDTQRKYALPLETVTHRAVILKRWNWRMRRSSKLDVGSGDYNTHRYHWTETQWLELKKGQSSAKGVPGYGMLKKINLVY